MRKHLVIVAVTVNLLLSFSVAAQQDWLYSVRPGDNIWNLCLKYTHKKDCWLTLGDYNAVEYPRQLPPGLIIRFPISWLREVPTPVTLLYFNGVVRYKTGSDSEWLPAQVGTQLPIGTEVTTAADSIVGLEFGDGSQMQVEPNSSVVLDALSLPGENGFVDSRVRLQSGAVKTRVPERQPKSRFQITTPAAIAAVRGTEFRVSAYDGDSGKSAMTGEVFNGVVAVAAGAKQSGKDVPAGYGIKAQQGAALADPKPLPPAPQWLANNPLQEPPITVSWQPLTHVDGYRVEISRVDASGKATELLAVMPVSEPQFVDAEKSFNQGCVQLAVRGIDREGLLGLASETQVCVRDKLATPEVGKRALNFNSQSNSVMLAWQPVIGASNYRVEISDGADFSKLIASYEAAQAEFSLPLDAVTQNGFYYRVQALAPDVVSSDYSPARAVTLQDEPLVALGIWSIFWVLMVAL